MQNSVDIVKHDKSVRVVILRSGVPGIFCAGWFCAVYYIKINVLCSAAAFNGQD
jgi:enoyl-CoA hydratase/carnithine racemase